MDSSYYKNYLGLLPMTSIELQRCTSPRVELGFHVTWKMAQTGLLIGMAIPAVLCGVVNKVPRSNLFYCTKLGGLYGTAIGTALGPPIAGAFLWRKKFSDDECYERCHRLRLNRGQIWIDRSMVLGSATGATAGVCYGEALFGACAGGVGGITLMSVAVLAGLVGKKPKKV